MTKAHQLIWGVLLGWGCLAMGQTDSGGGSSPAPQNTAPAPAYGQATPTAVDAVENPPITALDAPSLEPNIQPRSMLIGGVQGSESLDSNVNGTANSSQVRSITRLLGGLTMQRLWSRYNFAAAYVGGVGFYPQISPLVRNIQELQAQQGVAWKTGQFTVRDTFSYLPEGTFGFGAYGGAAGFELGLGGIGETNGLLNVGLGGHYGVLGSEQFGSLGQSPRINNVVVGDVVQALSPRSSVTAAGSYAVIHFTDDSQGLINSHQASGEVGYNRLLNPKDQIGLVYGYREFSFPGSVGADNVGSHIAQFLYGHRITGRMDLVIGAGPQWTVIRNPLQNSTRISASGRFTFRYRFPRTTLALSYQGYDTSGSGFFAGAESQIARVSASRQIGRRWDGIVDVGFSHNRRLQDAFLGVNATSYNYLFAGLGLRRAFTRNFGAFVSYQFNHQIFYGLSCTAGSTCNSTTDRHVITFGADWHFRPIRLD